MNNIMKTISIVLSIVFLVVVVGAFAWLWKGAQPDLTATSIIASTKYQTVEIETEKKTATDLMSGRENLSNLPLKALGSDKVGRDNPFAGL